MPAATFLGTTEHTYTQYLDTDPEPGGTTLVAEPQNTYQISVADNWQLGVPPGDGLWGAAPRGVLSFTVTPGSAVIGGASPGQPGFTSGPDAVEDVLAGSGPGDPLTAAGPATATFLGTSARVYTQYLDTDPGGPGTTLVAEPQNTYQISVADGWSVAGIPGDGLWGPVTRGGLSFTMTPGLAVIGGMSIGFPGFTSEPATAEDMFKGPAVVHAAGPSVRVVRGRGRKLRPVPVRRRSSLHARQRSAARR